VNDAGTLLAFFGVTVVLWGAFLLVVVVIVRGRHREKHPARIPAADVEHGAHRDHAAR
jgi:Na+-transporting methylmalonyl-CoA/oxaloacetate decarboxylase gamma subunit